jgi:ABC-type protease/lipase transport system fused ATPase/permease subunit
MDFPSLVIFLVIIYALVVVAIFIVFIRVLQLLEGELFNQRCIDEQRGNTQALINQAPDVFVGRP